MRARSGAAMRRVAAIRANRLSRQQHPFVAFAEVICALLLGLFGAGMGAIWSLALGFGVGIGALCAGPVVSVSCTPHYANSMIGLGPSNDV